MKRQKKSIIMFFTIIIFVISLCIPFHTNAQTLPIWALNPWGSTLGVGNASTPPYTIYNTAAAYSPWVPFTPYLPAPVYNPYYSYGYGTVPSPLFIPPTPSIRNAAATITIILPTATVVPSTAPVAPAPVISTTEFFLGLLLTIGHDSGLFYTNPALFWNIVGILY